MADHGLQLNFNPSNNCFGKEPVASTWSDGVPHTDFRILVHNTGTLWIDVVVEFGFTEYKTGHFNPGETRELVIPLPFVSGAGDTPGKITRWRPGLFGIPGNGGGEIVFGCPFPAKQAFVELNVPE